MMKHSQLKSIEKLANLLDTKFKGPFGWRFGLDGLVGLIPGIGDAVTSVMAFIIVGQAVMVGAPMSVLARMMGNIVIDNLVSSPPLIGPIFDFVWKSNRKNMRILQGYAQSPAQTTRRSRWQVGLTLTLLLIALAGLIAGILYLFSLFYNFVATQL